MNKRYFAGIGTHRTEHATTFRLLDTVEENANRYHELWAIDLEWTAIYQIRSISLLPNCRVEWQEFDFPTLDDALSAFNRYEKEVLAHE